MLQLPLATVFTSFVFFLVVGLVVYRLLWAASSFAGFGALPKGLQRWQRWIQGDATGKKISKKPN